MRVPQLKENPKGSQKWVQEIINLCPILLNRLIQQKIASLSGGEIQWTSPLEHDEFRLETSEEVNGSFNWNPGGQSHRSIYKY
jgi:hypothetical protein